MTNKEVPATRRRPMGVAWAFTWLALAAAIGSYYKPGPLQVASFVCVALSLVCLIMARRDELKEHHDQLTALRLEADLAHSAAIKELMARQLWTGIAHEEAAIIRAQHEAIHERDESAREIIERWAESIRPSTSARKAMAWMDDRSAYSTMAAAIFAARSGDEK